MGPLRTIYSPALADNRMSGIDHNMIKCDSSLILPKLTECISKMDKLRSGIIKRINNSELPKEPEECICPLCYEALKLPVRTSCNHLFCYKCLGKWIKNVPAAPNCPICRSSFPFKDEDDEYKPQGLWRMIYDQAAAISVPADQSDDEYH